MSKNAALFWVAKKMRCRLPQITVMTIAHILHAALGVCFALGTQQIIDSAVNGDLSALQNACIRQGMLIAAILVCIVLHRHLRDKLIADLDRDWKKHILHILLHGEYSKVSEYHSAELINRISNDVRILDESVLSIVPNVASMITRLVMAAAALAWLDPIFALIIITAGVLVVLATSIMRKSLKKLHKQVSLADGRISGFIQEIIEKLLMVQSMDVSDEVEKRSDKILDERYTLQRKRKNVSLFANTSINAMHYVMGFASLSWCAFRMMKGQMTFGSLTAVTQLVNQLQGPLVNISGVIPQYIAMLAAAERLMELDGLDSAESAEYTDGQELYNKMNGICGENITFRYKDDNVLDSTEFCIPKGSFAVITGPSGVGKSTLLKLVMGIFKCNDGNIFADCGSEKIPLDRTVKGLFAYVPQGNLILSGTVRENITITNPSATEDEINNALYISCADSFVNDLPIGLDTPLKENGAGLSEGQLQRIAIARAVLGNSPILLLDECTSALDEQTEKTVLSRIKAMENRTCIAITHREAAIKICDMQLEINSGKIKTAINN